MSLLINMESVVISYPKTLFTISFPSLWPLFYFMYKLLFSMYQNTGKGNVAGNSLGTGCVAVCLYSTMGFSAGIPGRHHWMCWRWPLLGTSLECVWCFLPVSLPAGLALVGECQSQLECSGKWGGTENLHSSLQRWLLTFCQVKASEMACSVSECP